MEQRYYVSEAAEELQVTPRTLKNWEKRAGFPVPRKDINGHRYYYPTDLLKIIEWRDCEPS